MCVDPNQWRPIVIEIELAVIIILLLTSEIRNNKENKEDRVPKEHKEYKEHKEFIQWN